MPDLTNLPAVVTLLIALSVATERLVEIVKGFFWQLNDRKEDPRLEARRRVWLHGLSVAGGIAISALAWPVVRSIVPSETPWMTVPALGLLASGGSGFWNTILTYILNLKELKKIDVQAAQQATAASRPLPQPAEGPLTP